MIGTRQGTLATMCRGDGWAIIMNGDYLKWESQMIKLHNRSSTQSGGKKKSYRPALVINQSWRDGPWQSTEHIILFPWFAIAHSSGSAQLMTK